MTTPWPKVFLARHGETAWTITGQHTGLTDIPLTDRGRRNAVSLGERLRGLTFGRVLTSPLQRARQTCELAGFGSAVQVDPDLVEWNYGAYEGRRTADIHLERPGWNLFRDGCPGGETAADVGQRADRVIERLRAAGTDVLIFAHSHYLRVLTARWLNLPATDARLFLLTTASLSILSYEHNLQEPVIRLWNDDRHVGD
jgi:probable phosphoglycerate mutase